MISVIADAEEKTAKVVVPDYQLSLAIGKEGQNARLAARLTGFKIDIKSETQAREAGDFMDYENEYEELLEEGNEEGYEEGLTPEFEEGKSDIESQGLEDDGQSEPEGTLEEEPEYEEGLENEEGLEYEEDLENEEGLEYEEGPENEEGSENEESPEDEGELEYEESPEGEEGSEYGEEPESEEALEEEGPEIEEGLEGQTGEPGGEIRVFPMRQCVGCGEMKGKKEMLRIIRTSEDEILLDGTGKKNGRGAYICPNKECFAKAVKVKGLERSLKMAIPKEVIENLAKEMEEVAAR